MAKLARIPAALRTFILGKSEYLVNMPRSLAGGDAPDLEALVHAVFVDTVGPDGLQSTAEISPKARPFLLGR